MRWEGTRSTPERSPGPPPAGRSPAARAGRIRYHGRAHSSIVESRRTMPKTAGIILIGNEILSGKIEDANAAYLCRELRGLGVDVRRISVVPDEVELIAAEVARQSADHDVVFTSGGVGPT